MLKQFARHHNKIQFFGYEVANVVLVLQQMLQSSTTGYGVNVETGAALFFLIGSALIWKFDPERRPQMLFAGGIALAIGGLFLTAAGYGLTGVAVIVASLETARGGVAILQETVVGQLRAGATVKPMLQFTLVCARYGLSWYQIPVNCLAGKFDHFGRFINERPFVTGALIKAPLRVEFVAKKLLIGDWIGVAVGLSWMVLGDVALAFNDAKLQTLAQHESLPAASSRPVVV